MRVTLYEPKIYNFVCLLSHEDITYPSWPSGGNNIYIVRGALGRNRAEASICSFLLSCHRYLKLWGVAVR